MRSFAVIAGLAAAANALAYGYEAQNTTSVAPPTYPATSSAPGYYPASSAPGYYGASSAPPAYTTTTVKGLTTVCNGPTTISVGTKTYTVTKSTTLIDNDCEYTTTVPVAYPTPVKGSSVPAYVPGKPSSAPVVPGVSSAVPVIPYPSSNGTVPTYPAGTGKPAVSASATKPSSPQFTGAAGKATVGFFAMAGAVVAFL